MTKQLNPLPLRPIPLSEENVESRQQHPLFPSVKPAPDISPAPTETPQPSQVPITDSFEKGSTDKQSPTIKDTGGETNMLGPPIGELRPEEVQGRRRKWNEWTSGRRKIEMIIIKLINRFVNMFVGRP